MPNENKKTEKCFKCGSILELYELDMNKEIRILKCVGCGLFYLDKKGLLGWKTQKVSKDPSRLLY